MRPVACTLLLLLGAAAAPARADVPVTLRGSPESMTRQNAVAKREGLPFVQTPAQMRRLAAEGALVPLPGNDDYALREGMRDAVARPEMRLFVERLAAQYREGCGERLVVTSVTRPASRQPGNAHALSVHPAGIAVDLRVSRRAACRAWLERTLLGLEARGVLDITREYRPPHYHVALFPQPYLEHVRRLEEGAPAAEPTGPASLAPAASGFLAASRDGGRAVDGARGATGETEGGGRPWSRLAALPLALIGAVLLRRRNPFRR